MALLMLAAVPAGSPELPIPSASPVATADVHAEGRALLLKCEKSFLHLSSMKGTIRERAVEHGGGGEDQVSETESDFFYKRTPENEEIRFENVVPLPHSVIYDGQTLTIWSPQENAAAQEPAGQVDVATRATLSLQPGFGIDPIAAIPLDEFKTEVKRIEGPKTTQTVVLLTPLDSSVLRATMRLVVDPDKMLVTRIVSSQQDGQGGMTVADIEMTDPVEAKPGIWFATRVHTRLTLGNGLSIERLKTFERLKFDSPIDEEKFRFQVPQGAKVVPLSAAKLK